MSTLALRGVLVGAVLASLTVALGCGSSSDLRSDCKRVAMRYAELVEAQARDNNAPMPPISIRDEMIERCLKANTGKDRRIPVACVEKATTIAEANACTP